MHGEIKDGDTVCLKSGGPFMTVSHVSGEYAACVWFDLNHQAHDKSFRLVEIVKDSRRDQR
ncbi:DUF2158 domain-containing protein [Bradyrhizobium symbiodeficiens]|uniref:DUF2158 domain-containing protein n=1 Tax=Bradyrhizobium symbiodeficiens TaxID=1404367 RepID=UPI00140F8267|nr:DUF2158 domain-containing protein [Bradyrhizobium symbiodeficiens]QIO98812.1 DUF2158 domain-containing protein [Bradyrhizobium symbiodeficiens]